MKTGTLDVDEGEDETDGTDIFSLTSQSSLSSTSDCGQEGGDYNLFLSYITVLAMSVHMS